MARAASSCTLSTDRRGTNWKDTDGVCTKSVKMATIDGVSFPFRCRICSLLHQDT